MCGLNAEGCPEWILGPPTGRWSLVLRLRGPDLAAPNDIGVHVPAAAACKIHECRLENYIRLKTFYSVIHTHDVYFDQK